MFGKVRTLIYYPFLFSLYPVLSFYSKNLSSSYAITSDLFMNLFLPLLISLGSAIIIYSLLNLLFKKKLLSAAVVAIIMFAFFSYGHIYNMLEGVSLGKILIGRHRYLFPAYSAFFMLLIVLSFIINWKYNGFIRLLNYISVILILFPLSGIIINRIAGGDWSFDDFKKNHLQVYDLEVPEKPPDIFYIVLDEYANSHTLSEKLDFDNSYFLNYLSEKGFYNVTKSRTNYGYTIPSLTSTLNMMHLNDLDSIANRHVDNSFLLQMLYENRVVRMLKKIGYKFIYFHPGVSTFPHNRLADREYYYQALEPVHGEILQTTLLKPFLLSLQHNSHQKAVLSSFTELGRLQSIDEPKFVFAHIMCPHEPLAFGPDGEKISLSEWMNWRIKKTDEEWARRYVNQIKFVNGKVQHLVEELLSDSARQPIIIIQSDHGIGRFRGNLEPGEQQKLVMRNFLSCYFPDGGSKMLYDDLTSVNIFRILFNYYFNASFIMLPDISYYSKPLERYEFVDVTDSVRWEDVVEVEDVDLDLVEKEDQ